MDWIHGAFISLNSCLEANNKHSSASKQSLQFIVELIPSSFSEKSVQKISDTLYALGNKYKRHYKNEERSSELV